MGNIEIMRERLDADVGDNWWNEMPRNVREEAEEAMLQADRGEAIPHEEIKKRYSEWFVR